MGVIKFFDRLEDKIRASLSRRPILYALITGIGAVLFFRGVWMLADMAKIPAFASLALSLVILLSTGAFVSHFVYDRLIISGIRNEKKLIEKTAEEIESEERHLETMLSHIKTDTEEIKRGIAGLKK